EVAEILGDEQDLSGAGPRRGWGYAQELCAGYVPVSIRRGAAHGAYGELHGHRHHRAISADGGDECASSDGLGCVWVAGRAIRDQEQSPSPRGDRDQHQEVSRADPDGGDEL